MNSYPSVNTVQSFGVHRIKPYGPRREKTCLRGFANNKGADHPVTSKISSFQLISLAEETGLYLAMSEKMKTGYVTPRPIL